MYLINQEKTLAYNSADITNVFIDGVAIYITTKSDGGALIESKVAECINKQTTDYAFELIIKMISNFQIAYYKIPSNDNLIEMMEKENVKNY